MAAPDRSTLYNVAPAVEEAVRSLLVELEVCSAVYIQRETDNLPDSRIDVRVEIGGNYGLRSFAWQAQLVVTIWTDRRDDGPAIHAQRTGGVLAALPRVPCGEHYHPLFDASILPYHVINWIVPSGIAPQVSITDDLDQSEMRFDLIISVRPGAFPVVNTNTADSGYTADSTEITADAA